MSTPCFHRPGIKLRVTVGLILRAFHVWRVFFFSAFHAAGNATRRMNIFRTLCKVSISPWIDAREKGAKNKNKKGNSATLCSVSRINRSVWPEKSFSTVLRALISSTARLQSLSSAAFAFYSPIPGSLLLYAFDFTTSDVPSLRIRAEATWISCTMLLSVGWTLH